MATNDDDTAVDTRGVEDVGTPIGFEPSSVLDQARQGGITKPNMPFTNAGGTPYDADTLNAGLRGLTDVLARKALGLDPGD